MIMNNDIDITLKNKFVYFKSDYWYIISRRFSRGIGLVLMRRCGKNLAVEGCSFWAIFGKTTSVEVQDNCE